MPITHDVVDGVLIVERTGSITSQDEDGAFRDRRSDRRIHPGIPVLVDCRRVEPPDTPTVIQDVAQKVSALAAQLRCGPVAVLVNTDVEYGMGRMFQALTELTHPQTAIFRDENQAREWLRAGAGQGDATPAP